MYESRKTISSMIYRLTSLVLIIFFQQYCCTIISQGGQLTVHSYHNEMLYGFSYRNITTSSMQECLQHCLSDCLCQSFQICGNTCQLCSTTGGLMTAAVRHESVGCNRFEFENRKNLYLHKDHCRGCTTGINCCLTSQPCDNNGICLPLPSNNTRFTCECVDGYTGHRCAEKAKSCRGYLDESHKAGNLTIKTIFDNSDKPYTVRCSFDSNMAWTLVQSYKYIHKDGHNTRIYTDSPKNQDSPSWADYRLSLSRMNDIQKDSNQKWRLTCNFNTEGLVKTDYAIATHAEIPLLNPSIKHNGCKRVEFIDIRGTNCSDCTVVVAQNKKYPLQIDSYYSGENCKTNFPGSLSCGGPGEDNFGFYGCANDKHRCSSSSRSTTQLWFGGDSP